MQQSGFLHHVFLKAGLGISFQQCILLVTLCKRAVFSSLNTAQMFQMGKQFTKGLTRLKQFKLISR